MTEGARGLPPTSSLNDVLVRIRKAYKNPNVGQIEQVVLRPGPRAFRIVTLMEIIDPATGEHHHFSLKIDSIDKTKAGWFSKPERSVRLEGHDPDEIEHLSRFLQAHLEGRLSDVDGDLHVIRTDDYENLEHLLEHLPRLASPDMIELVKVILPRIGDSSEYVDDFIQAFEGSEPDTVKNIAIASRIVQHRHAFERLTSLVSEGCLEEHVFQELLAANPWMFGSEYSELLDRRGWTRDDKLDFMLRRTSDNYLEIVEIKTPFEDSLLIHDKSHDSYYPSSKLSPVLGQVIRYIAELERDRDSIRSKDQCDTLKIRARVIIGRDGDEPHREALRNLNAHVHRIEVVTFDQLTRIAGRVLGVFDSEAACAPQETGGEAHAESPF